MNKIFRLIWSEAQQAFIAVAEIVSTRRRGSGKRGRLRLLVSSLVLGLGICSDFAMAGNLPTGGNIVAGSGSIATNGSTMTVQQDGHKLIADWTSFSIGENHAVNFVQPGRDAAALNRVTGDQVSEIRGALNANGQVFLVNPSGIVFGTTAQVDVGSLAASTLNITNEDFLAGTYRFAGDSQNAIVNQGRISAADGGAIALVAARIVNDGALTATGGNVLMGAGSRVLLDLGGPVKIEVEQGALDALIDQGGAIKAAGGLVYLTAKAAGDLASTVINHTGVIEAQTLITGEKGEIRLEGDPKRGNISVAGTLDASAPKGNDSGAVWISGGEVALSGTVAVTSPAGKGGQAVIEGESIVLKNGSKIDATGATGGGVVLVGGDWEGGANAERRHFEAPDALRQATKVVMEEGALIDASATVEGAGGKVVLWSDTKHEGGRTDFLGTIKALGANGGSGGQVETSGRVMELSGMVHAGQGGEWLIDPVNIVIASSNPGYHNYTYYSAFTLSQQLGSGTAVSLSATNNLEVHATVGPAGWSNSAPLTLTAGQGIFVLGSGGFYSFPWHSNQHNFHVTLTAPYISVASGAYMDARRFTINMTDVHQGGFIDALIRANIFTKQGPGSLLLRHTGNSHDSLGNGATYIQSGQLFISSRPNQWDQLHTFDISSGATLTFDNANYLNFGGSYPIHITGLGNFRKTNLGGLHFGGSWNASLTAKGAITIEGGSLSFDSTTWFEPSADSLLTVGHGASLLLANNLVVGNIAGGGTIHLGHNNYALNLRSNTDSTFSGSITGNGSLRRHSVGGSVLTLSGSNTYTGQTIIQSGTLRLGGSNVLSSSTVVTVDDWAGCFELNGFNQTVSGIQGLGPIRLNGGRLTVNVPTGQTITSGNYFYDTAGGLTKTGAGVLQINNGHSYSGALIVNQGIFRVWSGNDRFTSVNGLTVSSGAFFESSGTDQTLASIAGSGTISLGSGLLTVGGTNLSTTFSGVISGSGGRLTKNGTGTLTLSGSNTYTGLTTLSAGSIDLAGGSLAGGLTFNASNLTLNAGSGTAGIAGNVTLNSNSIFNVGTGASLTLSGIVSGSQTLNKNGLGTLTLLGANTYTGQTNVNAGTLRVGAGGTAGTLGTHANVVLGSGATLALDRSNSVTIDKTISGAGGILAQRGSGTTTLTGTNTYTGGTTISGGTLSINGLARVGSGNFTLSGGTLLVTANTVFTGRTFNVSGNSGFSLAGGVLAQLGQWNAAGSTLTLSGAGTFELNDLNNDFGTVAAGGVAGLTLYDRNDLQLGTINAGGIVNISAFGALTLTNTIGTTLTGHNSAISLTGARIVNSHAGADTLSVGAGSRWLVWSKNADPFAVGSGDSYGSINTRYAFKQYGYNGANLQAGATGNGLLLSYVPGAVTPILVGATSKVYDGTNTFLGTIGVTGAVDGDTVTLNGSATYNSKDVLTAATISVDGLTQAGVTNAGRPVYGAYTLSTTSVALAGRITPKNLNLTGLAVADKVYDGTNVATISTLGTLSGFVGTETLHLSPGDVSAAFDTRHAGTDKTVTAIGTLQDGENGGLASNYQLLDTTSADITPAALTLSTSDITKEYDGTTNGAGSLIVTSGQLFADDSVSGGTFTFDNRHVSRAADGRVLSNKVVSVSAATLADGNAGGNYTISYADNSTSTITPKHLNIDGVSADHKKYDGTTDASVNVDAAALVGVIGADAVNLVTDSVSGRFADQHVGNAKPVGLSGFSLAGGNNGNYELNVAGGVTANITPFVVNLTGARIYDGTQDVAPGILRLSALVGGETLNLSGRGSLADKHVGVGKTITLGTLALGDGENGGLAGNYTLVAGTHRVDVSPFVVSLSGTRAYDGSATVAHSALLTNALPVGETLSITGAGSIGSKNVGAYSLALATLALGNGTGQASDYTLTGGTHRFDITRLGSVTWIGGASGNWFDPANWAGGAVPDLANVADVVIADDTTVFFDDSIVEPPAEAGDVFIDSLTGGGLSMSSGSLKVDQDVRLTGLIQTGGSIDVNGDMDIEETSGSVLLGNLRVGGTLGVNASDDITQTDGSSVTVAGVTDLEAGGDIDLSNSDNNFGGPVSAAATNIALADQDDIELGEIVASGDLHVTAGNDITQSGGTRVTVAGVTDLEAEGDINLSNATNNFDGPVNATATNITLADEDDIELGNIAASGDLEVSAGKDITQTDGTSVTVAGTTDLEAGGDINLSNATNKFDGPVSAAATNITLADQDDIELGEIVASGDLHVTAGNDITQSGGTSVTVAGTTDLEAGGDINLSNADNNFRGSVNAAGTNITLVDQDDIELGNIVASGDLHVTAGNDITQTDDTRVTVVGTTDLEAGGDINLSNATNNFDGPVNAAGQNIALADEDDIVLGEIVASGDLHVTAGNDITQTDDTRVTVVGTTDLEAGGDINLSNATNKFDGSVSAAATNITLADQDDIELGEIVASGDLHVTAGKDITQSGDTRVTVAGTTDLEAGGDIDLSNADNNFDGPVSLTGNHIGLNATSNLTIGPVSAKGNLSVNSVNGNVLQSGRVFVGGASAISAKNGKVHVIVTSPRAERPTAPKDVVAQQIVREVTGLSERHSGRRTFIVVSSDGRVGQEDNSNHKLIEIAGGRASGIPRVFMVDSGINTDDTEELEEL